MVAPRWEEADFPDDGYESFGKVVDALLADLPGEPTHENVDTELLDTVETVEWLASDDHHDALRLHFESGLVANVNVERVGNEEAALRTVTDRVAERGEGDEEGPAPTEKVRVITGSTMSTHGFESDINDAIAEEAAAGYRLVDVETTVEELPRDNTVRRAVLLFEARDGGEADE
jgi:hypothetical protein